MKIINTLKITAIAGVALMALNSEAGFTSFAFFNSQAGTASGMIQFSSGGNDLTGGTFNFSPGGNPNTATGSGQWEIGSSSGFNSSINGLYGSVLSSTPYSYGPIVTDGSGNQTAVVSSSVLGQLVINDGLGTAASDYLTGTVNWITLSSTLANQQVNTSLAVNITSLAYTGSNIGLQQLETLGNFGGAGITVSFSTGGNLSNLAANGNGNGTTFTGTIAVPEPTTIMAGAMLLLPFGASTLRVMRRKSSI